MTSIDDELVRMRELLDVVIASHGYSYLRDCDGRTFARRGVYFFFDDREPSDPVTGRLRIVRVGTHALRLGETSTLWGRLRGHRGSMGGAWPGGGNHRVSVFRKHVGRALLRTGAACGDVASWDAGASAPPGIRAAEYATEVAVSQYIRALPFINIEIDDVPGPDSDRGRVERGAIARLGAAARGGAVEASDDWLGLSANRVTITESLLWNVNHVDDERDPHFLDALARWVEP